MWYLQSKGPDTITLLDEGDEDLFYELPAYGVHMPFRPADFTQVNPYINEVLVSRALNLLGVQKHERVFDWFCGLGNFTLPLATQGAEVVGVEGSEILVNRGIANYARFHASKKTLRPTEIVMYAPALRNRYVPLASRNRYVHPAPPKPLCTPSFAKSLCTPSLPKSLCI